MSNIACFYGEVNISLDTLLSKAVIILSTVKLRWVKHLWDHGNLLGDMSVPATEG